VTRVKERVDQAARDIDRAPASMQQEISHAIGEYYLALGRIRDAERFLVSRLEPDAAHNPHWSAASLAVVREDPPSIRRHLTSFLAGRRGWPNARPMMFIRAGMLDEARRGMAAAAVGGFRNSVSVATIEIGLGELGLKAGDINGAIAHLQKGLALLKGSRLHEYHMGCESLAIALDRAARSREVIPTLEACAAERPRIGPGGVMFTQPSMWMRLKLRLAEEYRNVGRIAEATATENEVRRLLVYADTDHPLVKRLEAMAGSTAAATSRSRLDFRPRDTVLISRFDNRTGESIFDGAVEYALEREFTSSGIVGLASRERVDDALRMMKRPADTVVDREVGREVALRDGHIKAVLAGRIEKFGSRYALTTQLIDPLDGTVAATIAEDAVGTDAVIPALRRLANGVRVSLGEKRDTIKGADSDVQSVSTRSLRAFRLHTEFNRLALADRWAAALEIAKKEVEEDPEFASGWIALAWATRNVSEVPYDAGRAAVDKVSQTYRPFLERAMKLSASAPPWERYWIAGSYYRLLGDDARALPEFEALVKLRPDHWAGGRNLHGLLTRLGRIDEALAVRRQIADHRPNDFFANYEAAALIIERTGNVSLATPYIDRLNALAASVTRDGANTARALVWTKWLPTYLAWRADDVAAVGRHIEAAIRSLDGLPGAQRDPTQHIIAEFALALGRLDEAETYFVKREEKPDLRHWNGANIALARDDTAAISTHMREWLDELARQRRPIQWSRPMLFVRAGLVDEPRRTIAYRQQSRTEDKEIVAFADIAAGELALRDGDAAAAVPHLEKGVANLRFTGYHDYYGACESLATAFSRLQNTGAMLHALERCAADVPRFRPGTAYFSGASLWMHLRLRLADEYRTLGRVGDAKQIESDVRGRLALADKDHPLLVRLRDRK
jgi:tetratricopeptide (TPR) repeat protein